MPTSATVDNANDANDAKDQHWESLKETVRELYLIQDYSLEEVTKKLNDRVDTATITKSQVEYRCKKWNFRKNLSRGEWKVVTKKIQKRRRDGEESEIIIEGLPMTQKKVKKAVSRYGFFPITTNQVTSPRTPEGVMIQTPAALSVASPESAHTQTSLAAPPAVVSYVTNVLKSLPFANFKLAARSIVYQDVAPLNENDSMSISRLDDIQTGIATHLQEMMTIRKDLKSFYQNIEALIPEALNSSYSTARTITARNHSAVDIDFLNLALFMLSNKSVSLTAASGEKSYRLIEHLDDKVVIENLLSVGGPTSEALAEQVFFLALKRGDSHVVRSLLRAGLDPNELKYLDGQWRYTPLQLACYLRNLEVVKILVSAGAHINAAASEVASPLMLAVWPLNRHQRFRGHVDIELVKVLLDAGADVNPALDEPHVTSPLMSAATVCQLDLVSILLANGADPNFTCECCYTNAVFEAIRSKESMGYTAPVVKLLIQAGANIYTKSQPELDEENERYSLLDIAVAVSKKDVIKVILDQGFYPEESALLIAITKENFEVITLLVGYGAQLSEKVIEHAVRQTRPAVLHLLFDLADDSIKEACRSNALIAAMKYGIKDLADDLRTSGVVLRPGTKLASVIEAAASRGDLSVLSTLLEILSKSTVDFTQCLDSSLFIAIAYGRSDIAEFLLEAGADVDGGSEFYGQPLLESLHNGDVRISQRLLALGASVNLVSENDKILSVLPVAVCLGDHPLIRDIIRAGANVNALAPCWNQAKSYAPARGPSRNPSGWHRCVLGEGIREPDWECQGGHGSGCDGYEFGSDTSESDYDEFDSDGFPLKFDRFLNKASITIAIERGDIVTARELVQAGADVNMFAAQFPERTALSAAIDNHDLETVHWLFNLGAEPDDQALTTAVNAEYSDIVQLLLTAKMNRCGSFPQGYGVRAIRCAVILKNFEILKILLTSGIDPNTIVRPLSRDNIKLGPSARFTSQSLFGSALDSRNGNEASVLSLLLDFGADPNGIVVEPSSLSTGAKGWQTALLHAIAFSTYKVIKMLIDSGADADAKTTRHIRRTPLQLAVEEGRVDITRLLIQHQADVNAPPHNRAGATALQFAAIYGHLGIACLLLERGAVVDAPGARFDGRTALEAASEHGRIDMVQLLLSAGARVTGSGSEQYERARSFARENGHAAVRRLLEKAHQEQLDMEAWYSMADVDLPAWLET